MSADQQVRSLGAQPGDSGTTFLDVLIVVIEHWKMLVVLPLLAAAAAAGISMVVPQTFTGRTSFLPPQTQQGAGSAALASIGALAGLAGGGVRTPADQYAALLQSDVVRNRLIEKFALVQAYEVKLAHDARKRLTENTRITVGRRDGLIVVEVDDQQPDRAAALANAYVEELKVLSARLALTEAQQRRVFFETEMKQTRDRLARAQEELQRSGFGVQTLRAEPKAAAENYARLQAQLTAADVRLQSLRRTLTDNAPEVAQQLALVGALRREVSKIENDDSQRGSSDEQYVGRYREFRYQETLLDLLARQYELARLDESKDGASLQVVDVAAPPERRTSPKRGLVTAATAFVAFVLLIGLFSLQASLRAMSQDEATRAKLARLRAAVGLRR